MVITPRQVQDSTEEISALKSELATLKDEVQLARCPATQSLMFYTCCFGVHQGSIL